MEKSVERIIMLLLFVVGITGILLCSKLNVFKKDYTEKYLVYKDIAAYSSLAEIKQYLSDNKIEYTIENSMLCFKNNDLFYFTVNSSGQCSLVSSNTIKNFEKLDENSYYTVKVTATVVDNKLVEETSLTEDSTRYTKVLNRYYVFEMTDCALVCVISILLLIMPTISFLHAIIMFFYHLKEKHKKKICMQD